MPESSKCSPSLRFTHQNPCMHLSSPSYVLHVPFISFFLVSSPERYLVRSTEHEAPRCVVFSTPLLSCPSQAQISFSAPYSRAPSAYVSLSTWATKFHTHIKQEEKLYFCIQVGVSEKNFVTFQDFTVRKFSSRSTLKLEDCPLSTVHDCLFSVFTAALHVCRPSPPSATSCTALYRSQSAITRTFLHANMPSRVHTMPLYASWQGQMTLPELV